jgi:peptide/nickel transport system permease protein
MTDLALPQKSPSARLRGRYLRMLWRRFSHERVAVGALVFIVILIALAVFAPLVVPYPPNLINLSVYLQAPSAHHLMGTDALGRDVLSRIIYGSRVSLIAAAEVLLVSSVIGIPTGMVAGYYGGRIDAVLSRMVDAMMSVPGLLFALTMIAALGPGLVYAMLAVGIIIAPRYFRVTRAVTSEIVKETYIEACESIGCKPARVIRAHVFPNLLPNLVVQTSIILGIAVNAEASLSFLGLGVPQPTASWGSMLSDALANVTQSPYLVIFPGAMITLTVLAFTIIGTGVNKALGGTMSVASDGI